MIDSDAISANVGLRDDILSGWYNSDTGELYRHFPINAGDVVLDVGCGDGANATFCARRGARLILCDVNASKIAAARGRLSVYHDLRLDTHVTDGNPLPLPADTATHVICTEVLEHVDDPVALLHEMARVGRPDALYLISVPGTTQEMVQKRLATPEYFQKPNHIRIFQPGELATIVRSAGLTIEHTGSFGFYRSVWTAFWWQCRVTLENPRHPSLDSWAHTWSQVLDGPDGKLIKEALDAVLPKSQVIVARK
jgi:2-polyprenyl-3-methyl-5-hydroxy-6-metoxy-1,4-benzoquinol methylase